MLRSSFTLTSLRPVLAAAFVTIAPAFAYGQSPADQTATQPTPQQLREEVDRLRAEFHRSHERAYGYAAPDDPVELVNVRLAAVGVTPKPRRTPLREGGHSTEAAVKGRRDVWLRSRMAFSRLGCSTGGSY